MRLCQREPGVPRFDFPPALTFSRYGAQAHLAGDAAASPPCPQDLLTATTIRKECQCPHPLHDAGALGPMVEQFTDELLALGHTRFTVNGFDDSARHFADWTSRSGIAPCEVGSGTIDQLAQHTCLCLGGAKTSSRLKKLCEPGASVHLLPRGKRCGTGVRNARHRSRPGSASRRVPGMAEASSRPFRANNKTASPRAATIVAGAWRRSHDIRPRPCPTRYR